MSWSSWGIRKVGGPAGAAGLTPSVVAGSNDKASAKATEPAGGAFQDQLRKSLQKPLRWSRHAEQRLRSSGVILNKEDICTIEGAVETLAQRGTKDALVVYGRLALVVSVRNRTVVTAATPDRWQEGIFTNIDGAALINKEDNSGAGPQVATAGEAPRPLIDGSGPYSGRFRGL